MDPSTRAVASRDQTHDDHALGAIDPVEAQGAGTRTALAVSPDARAGRPARVAAGAGTYVSVLRGVWPGNRPQRQAAQQYLTPAMLGLGKQTHGAMMPKHRHC